MVICEIKLRITTTDGIYIREIPFTVEILPASLPEEDHICTNWFYTDCLADYYEVTPFSERHLEICENFIKTAVENGQDLIVEGCYIPPDWSENFTEEYLCEIKCYCLVMSEKYIENHFGDIIGYADVIEKRLDDDCTKQSVLEDNACFTKFAQGRNVNKTLRSHQEGFWKSRLPGNAF